MSDGQRAKAQAGAHTIIMPKLVNMRPTPLKMVSIVLLIMKRSKIYDADRYFARTAAA